jgi:hypothetical protein
MNNCLTSLICYALCSHQLQLSFIINRQYQDYINVSILNCTRVYKHTFYYLRLLLHYSTQCGSSSCTWSTPLGQYSYFTVKITGIMTAPDYFTLESNVLAHFIQNTKQNLHAFLKFSNNFEETTKCFSHQ